MTFLKLPDNESALNFDGERFVPCADVSDELAMEHVHRYAAATGFISGKTVVDIACGEGYGSYILSQVAGSVIGVDVDQKAVEHAQSRYKHTNLTYKVGSCNSIPCQESSVDVVVSFETLEHISEQDDFMKEVKRVLKSDGVLLLSTPNIDQYNALRDETNPFHLKELNREEFENLLGKHFKTYHIGGQAGFFCSSLVFDGRANEDNKNRTAFSVFSQNSEGEVAVEKQPLNPAYLIAVASDSEIPLPSSSFYEGNIKRNIISALEGGIVERDSWCLEKDTQIRDLNEKITSLQETEKNLLKQNVVWKDKCAARDADLDWKNGPIQESECDISTNEFQRKKCLCSQLFEKLGRIIPKIK